MAAELSSSRPLADHLRVVDLALGGSDDLLIDVIDVIDQLARERLQQQHRRMIG